MVRCPGINWADNERQLIYALLILAGYRVKTHTHTDFTGLVFYVDVDNMQIFATILLNRCMLSLINEKNDKFKNLVTPPSNFFLNGVALDNVCFGLCEMKFEYLANIFLGWF